MSLSSHSLLEVEDFGITLEGGVPLVESLSFSIEAGQRLALVGESGSGKSVTGLGLLGLAPGTRQGSIRLAGERLGEPGGLDWKQVRGCRIAMIFQDALGALNPVRRVGWHLLRVLRRHRGLRGAEAVRVARAALDEVKMPADVFASYPHQLSGGMRQRVMIAMALLSEPDLIIADEPTTALDVMTENRILQLLDQLCRKRGLAMLFITHDLGLVRHYCPQTLVLYAGRLAEQGATAALFANPGHPYTRALIDCIPVPRLAGSLEPLQTISGSLPEPASRPAGCHFEPRCSRAQPDCQHRFPDEVAVKGRRHTCLYPLS